MSISYEASQIRADKLWLLLAGWDPLIALVQSGSGDLDCKRSQALKTTSILRSRIVLEETFKAVDITRGLALKSKSTATVLDVRDRSSSKSSCDIGTLMEAHFALSRVQRHSIFVKRTQFRAQPCQPQWRSATRLQRAVPSQALVLDRMTSIYPQVQHSTLLSGWSGVSKPLPHRFSRSPGLFVRQSDCQTCHFLSLLKRWSSSWSAPCFLDRRWVLVAQPAWRFRGLYVLAAVEWTQCAQRSPSTETPLSPERSRTSLHRQDMSLIKGVRE